MDLIFTIEDKETGKVVKENTLKRIDLNNLRRVTGPFWNNHIAYQVKKYGIARIHGDTVTYIYRLGGK